MLIAIVVSAICSLCEACLSSTPMSFVSTLKGKSGADTKDIGVEDKHASHNEQIADTTMAINI